MARIRITIASLVVLLAGISQSWGQPPAEASKPIEVHAVPAENGKVALTPENTLIQFVGKHVGEQPDPRVGNFQKFQGELALDAAKHQVKSVQVEIDVASLWTPIPDLSRHLGSPDFFDNRQFPTATFKSTSIKAGSKDGLVTIHGELTMHGETKPIEIPANLQWSDAGVTLQSEMILDRTEFGMAFGTDRVEKDVALTIAVGAATPAGTDPRMQGPGGGREFDPVARFKERDVDSDGFLSGDEISERLRARMENVDKNSDGKVSQEEFVEGVRAFQRGGGPGDRPQRTNQRPQRPASE